MSETILIVDDEYLARNHLKNCIKQCRADVNVLEASTGKEALDISIATHPKLIFMDIILPDLNGLIAAQQILQSLHDVTSICFLTAYDYFSYAQEAIRIGAKQFLLKPITKHQTEEILNEFLGSQTFKSQEKSQTNSCTAGKSRISGSLENIETEFFDKLKLKDLSGARKRLDVIAKNVFSGVYTLEQIKGYICEFGSIYNRTVTAIYPTSDGKLSWNIRLFLNSSIETLPELQELFTNEVNRLFAVMVNFSNDAGTDNMEQKLMLFLNTHFKYDLSLDDLASALNTNPTYLSIKFKELIGESFSDYMRNKRLSMAKHLLVYSSDNLREISEKVGYTDVSYFCRFFKKHVGLSPRAYRNCNTVDFN